MFYIYERCNNFLSLSRELANSVIECRKKVKENKDSFEGCGLDIRRMFSTKMFDEFYDNLAQAFANGCHIVKITNLCENDCGEKDRRKRSTLV